jgi:allophanate hydrolase subunit 1
MQKGQEVFIYQELAAGQFAILGRALVSSFDSTQDAQAIVTVSYTFRFQSDFVYFTPASYNTPAAVTQYNNVRRLFGQVEVA